MKKRSILAFAIAALGLLWIFAAIAYTVTADFPQLCWGSVAGVTLAVFAAEVYLLALKTEVGEEGREPSAIGIIITIVFLMVTGSINSAFVLTGHGNVHWVLMLLNLLVLVVYIIVLLFAEHSVARLAKQLEKTAQKTAPSIDIARKLGELLSIAEDDEIRNKLLKLKEMVDYGTNISTQATADKEAKMGDQLDEILRLMLAHSDRFVILEKVAAAEMTWKMRSSTASSVR